MSDNFHLGGKARRHRGPGVQQPSALSALWSTSCSVARMPTRHTQRPAAMPMTWAMRRYARVPGPAWRYRASGQRGGQSSREAFPERSRQAVALSFCCQQGQTSAVSQGHVCLRLSARQPSGLAVSQAPFFPAVSQALFFSQRHGSLRLGVLSAVSQATFFSGAAGCSSTARLRCQPGVYTRS